MHALAAGAAVCAGMRTPAVMALSLACKCTTQLPAGMQAPSSHPPRTPHAHAQYYAPRKTYVYDLNGAIVDRIELPGDVFGHPVRRDILQRVVRWQMARRQQGTHSTKTRAEVGGWLPPLPPPSKIGLSGQRRGGRWVRLPDIKPVPGSASLANHSPATAHH